MKIFRCDCCGLVFDNEKFISQKKGFFIRDMDPVECSPRHPEEIGFTIAKLDLCPMCKNKFKELISNFMLRGHRGI